MGNWSLLRLSVLLLAGLVLLGLMGGLAGRGDGGAQADTWECIEMNTDYSQKCLAKSDYQCGRYCFYAKCVKCTDGYHDHTTCGLNSCWTVTHRHGKSPCVDWEWYLWDEPLDAERAFETMSPNLQQAFMFGATHPDEAECVEDGGVTDILNEGSFGDVKERADSYFYNKAQDTPPHEAAGHLADTVVVGGEQVRGGADVPVLVNVLPVAGLVRTYRLVHAMTSTGRVQYRIWPYSGFVPDDFGDPYYDLPPGGEVVVEMEGLHSFQVRTVVGGGADPEVLGTSNVVHKVVGMSSANTGVGLAQGLYTPEPVATPWALPPPASGAVRPDPPEILSVVEDPLLLGRMLVEMKPGFPGKLQYRHWTHSGFPLSEFDGGWLDAPPLVLGVFEIFMPRRSMYGGAGDPLFGGGFVKPAIWNFEHPTFYNFETRVVVGVESEGSNIVVAFVWDNPPAVVAVGP